MDRKKILIFSAIAIFVLLIAAILLFISPKNPSSTDKPSSSNTSSSNNQFPIASQTPKSDLTPGQIKDKFDSSVNSNPATQTSSPNWTKIRDNSGRIVPFPEFASAVGLNINPDISKLLDDEQYQVFSCSDKGGKAFGFYVSVKLMPEYGNLYQDTKKFMGNWESSILKDTAKIVFPGIAFTEDQLNQKLTFYDKDAWNRSAEVILPDGRKGAINYTVVDDYIIVSSSIDCLNKASDGLVS